MMVHEISIKEVTIYFFEMELGLDMCQPISMVEVYWEGLEDLLGRPSLLCC